MTYFGLLYLSLNPIELGIALLLDVVGIVWVVYLKKHHIKLFN